ncbi:hypothetical protein K431DRAFT_295901 [Polychaeton citri CBS 116435]|uniref:Uncharacterized protein n=1 Tax=Polychaeton citri CBS 116435 TaxID=1314669 RepID=A0A9P4Q4V5_9PEZI|nr:hypothetical protein K431DRAFT_295901 [Polychaeton citri CBS 116435]
MHVSRLKKHPSLHHSKAEKSTALVVCLEENTQVEKRSGSTVKANELALPGLVQTIVQATLQLAKYAKHLYIFLSIHQVDTHENKDTAADIWQGVAAGKGWRRKSNRNFDAHVSNAAQKLESDIVNDGCSKAAP